MGFSDFLKRSHKLFFREHVFRKRIRGSIISRLLRRSEEEWRYAWRDFNFEAVNAVCEAFAENLSYPNKYFFPTDKLRYILVEASSCDLGVVSAMTDVEDRTPFHFSEETNYWKMTMGDFLCEITRESREVAE